MTLSPDDPLHPLYAEAWGCAGWSLALLTVALIGFAAGRLL